MFLVYKDHNCPKQGIPYIVISLILTNIVVFIFQLTDSRLFTDCAGAIPYEIVYDEDLVGSYVLMLGEQTCDIEFRPAPLHPQLTLLTSIFMHGGFLHLIGNMLYLWIFGDQIEHVLGKVRFLVFYLLGGFVASLAQIAVDPQSLRPIVGASGAIAAILGAYFILFPRNSLHVALYFWLSKQATWFILGIWILTQIFGQIFASTSGVGYCAHIGGFVFGITTIYLFIRLIPKKNRVICCTK